jgi:ankyrin repeat protein
VQLLVEKGADVDSKDSSGRTPLSWAAGQGHEAVVRLLLATGGVDPDSKDGLGQTPLSWAAGQGLFS